MPFFSNAGRRLFFREQGSGPLLLILPGNTASSAHHAADLEYFAQRYHVVALDFWGTGQSERIDPWPLDWYRQGAVDALALAAHLGQPAFSVLGTSGGGVVALWCAIFGAERVRAAIVDSAVSLYPPDMLRRQVAGRDVENPHSAEWWRHGHGEDWRSVVAADSAFLLALADRGGQLFDGPAEQIRCPLLLTASLADPALPDVEAQVLNLVRQLPGSQVFLTHEGDHPLMWSRPAVFRGVACAFLDQAFSSDSLRASQGD